MSGAPTLVFAHANGYPPGAYQPLLARLSQAFRVLAPEARPLWPGARPEDLGTWDVFVEDWLKWAEREALPPVIGVGHSMGAITLLQAALKAPERFSGLVLIEPVLFTPGLLWTWRIVRAAGLGRRLHPLVRTTLRRRRHFASVAEMVGRYRRASVFRRIDDRGLHAYAESLAAPAPDGGVTLRFTPEWEARIYMTGAPDLWRRLPALKPPALIVAGSESDTFVPAAVSRARRALPRAEVVVVPEAGHLVPLEKPEVVAKLIETFVERSATDFTN
jgi:pimeloyl-ACP methyl ester carboxylesterase